MLDTGFPILEQCTWACRRPARRCGKKDFESIGAAAKHIHNHVARSKSHSKISIICRLSPCDGIVDPIIFTSNVSWYQHLLSVHRIPGSQNGKKASVDPYIHWCALCGRWLCQLWEDLDEHAARHEEVIGEIIRSEGFAGVLLGRMLIRPPLNPFSLYDESLQPSARFSVSCSSMIDTADRVGRHISYLADDETFPCPVSRDAGPFIKAICDDKSQMSKQDLQCHLKKAHGVLQKEQKRKGRTSKKTTAQDDAEGESSKGAETTVAEALEVTEKAKRGRKKKEDINVAPDSDVDDEGESSKRVKTTAAEAPEVTNKAKRGRQKGQRPILQPKTVNNAVGAAMKSFAST